MNNILQHNETMDDVVRRLEASFDTIRDIAPVAYWYENLNENGRVKDIHFSDEMRRLLGYSSQEEFPDALDTLMKFTHPDDIHIMRDNAIAAGTGNIDKYDVQYRIRKATGDYLWCNATGQVVKDCNGRIVGMYGAFIDITEEIELRWKQELMRQDDELGRLVDEKLLGEYDAIYIVNLDKNEIIPAKTSRVSKVGAFTEKKAYSELLRKFAETVDPKYKKDWINFSKPAFMVEYMAAEDHREYVYELPETRKAMRRFTVDVIERVNGRAEVVLFSFMGIDDARAQAIRLNRQLAEQNRIINALTEDFVYVTYVELTENKRNDQAITYRTSELLQKHIPGWEQEKGFTRKLGLLCDYLVYEPDRGRFIEDTRRENVFKQLEGKNAYFVNTRMLIDGQIHYYQLKFSPIQDELGNPFGVVFGLHSIDEQIKREQEQQEKMQKSLELANQQRYIKAFGDMVNAALWSMTINEKNEVIAVNWSNEFRRMFGFAETLEAFPNTLEAWSDRLHPDDRKRVLDIFYSGFVSTDTENYIYDLEYRILRQNGEYCWYHAVGRMEYNDDGTRKFYGIIFDISQEKQLVEQQRQLEKALAEATLANQRSKALHEAVKSGPWSYVVEPDNKTVHALFSDELKRLIHYDLSPNPYAWMDRVHPHDREQAEKAFRAALFDPDCRTPYDDTYRFMGDDGSYRWFNSAGKKIRRADGTCELFGMFVDVTDQMEKEREQQKQLEAALMKAEATNRLLDETSRHEKLKSDALEFMAKHEDLEAFVDFFSGRVLDLYGCDQVIYRDIEGRQILKERPGTKQLDFSLCASCPHFDFDAPVYGGGFTAMDDCKVGYNGIPVHPDCCVRASLTYLVYENEKVFGYIALHYLDGIHHFTDAEKNTFDRVAKFMSMVITRRKHLAEINEKNARFDIVKEVIHSAEWRFKLDADDRIVGCEYSSDIGALVHNEKASEHYDWQELVHPDDLQATQAAFNACIRDHSGKTPYDVIYRMIDRDGKYNWFRSAGSVIRYKDGTGDFFGLHIDINETIEKERENQRQLEEALAMAQSANRAKTTFLNNMSHDIRTPMNAIIGFTGLAASHLDNREQVRDYLAKIGQASNHLLSLINDVLDMSRIESGKMNLDEKEENLADILHTLRSIVQSDIYSKRLDFYVDAVDVNDEIVVCDKLRLNQVLLNILSNAIKYTPAGGTVAMRVTEMAVKANGYATYEFIVKDNGMGMSKEFLETIYDPFTRVKSSTVSGIQGTGLGMAITKNIIDMMGGTIDIQSEPGKGTEVTICFDFKLQNGPREPLRIQELEGLRALVVDDDSNTCLSVSGMLRDVGMRDEWCTSGKEAIIRAEQAFRRGEAFKVYIIDWLMPDMNGIETTRRIRKAIGEDVPIIILTSYDWSDIEDEAREAGVTAFVSKPMFPSDLHRVLNKCLGRQQPVEETPKDEFDFTGRTVLLVEDNELNREIVAELLTENGFIIELAVDGSQAVDLLKEHGADYYDFILMDIQMPVMDGYEATKAIRKMYPNAKLPIVALSANAFAEDKEASLAVGMNDHVAKPIKIKELFTVLAKYL